MNKESWSLKTLYEEFVLFEEKNDIFNKQIQGVLFWERIRFNIFLRLFSTKIDQLEQENKSISPNESSNEKRYLRKIMLLLRSIFYLKTNPLLSKKKEILILGSQRRKLKENEKWWDIYTDYFINELEYSSVSIEEDYHLRYLRPAQTKNIKYFKFLDVLTSLKRLFKTVKIELDKEETLYLELINASLKENFGINFDIKSFTYSMLLRRKRILPLYSKILSKIEPKVVIVVCSYGKENFIEACKTKNIPVVELQHGVITKFNTGYSFESEKAKKVMFPDYLFLFGDYWKNSLKYPIKPENIFITGYPELETQKKKYEAVEKKKQLVFISQRTIGKLLSKFAVELSKTELDYKIIYKLHPSECSTWKKDLPWLVESSIEVIDYATKDLFEIFAESSIQVGVYSTAIFEGLNFGLKTFLVDLPGIDYMQQLIESKIVFKVNNPDEMIKLIQERTQDKMDTERFFKSDSIKNILNGIKHILEK